MSYTIEELKELMKEREDIYSVLDLLDPTVEELVDALFEDPYLLNRNYDSLNEYYEEGIDE